MAKFLFTVWPVPGHIHPNIAVAHELRKLGHEVRFYTCADVHSIIEGEGFPYLHADLNILGWRSIIHMTGVKPRRLRAKTVNSSAPAKTAGIGPKPHAGKH